MCEELNLTVAGEIHFAETQILLQNIQIPNSFKEQVRLLTRVNISKVEIFYYHQADEQTESECRLNIGLYLPNAVYLARRYLDAGEIALFSEVSFEHEDLSGIGRIEGNLDYLTSTYAGAKDIGGKLNLCARLQNPYLLVVEAKTGSTISKDASLYQLIAQLITVEYYDP